MVSVEEILSELGKSTNLSREDLLEKINRKQKDMSGLISFEGAAHLVAREFGLDLLEKSRRELQIKNIVPGLKKVNVCGRIFKISPIVGFTKQNGNKGKVVNLFIGDATGHIRLPLWNEQVKLVEDESVKLGDAIQVTNGFAKENIYGDIEVSLGKFGSIIPIEDSGFPAVGELVKRTFASGYERTDIANLVPGNFEVKGNIVNVFKGKFLFNVCPVCGSSLPEKEGRFRCSEHGEVEPDANTVLSAIIDDGTEDMRIVFFRGQAEKVLGLKASELAGLGLEERYQLVKERILGKELVVVGRVKKSSVSGRLELIVNDAEDLNVLEESKKLADEIELRYEFTTGSGGKIN
jgi:ssDNA-binding replication factor A large subunit